MFSKIYKSLSNYNVILNKINLLEFFFKELSNKNIKNKVLYLKNKIKSNIDKYIHVVYSIIREISRRFLGLFHYNVQILGGIMLYNGKISEVSTGEGKTLIAVLPACLYAFINVNIHIITVNDYLVVRDSKWMKLIYNYFNFSIGIIISELSNIYKNKMYNCNILYANNSEVVFDYLRDNVLVNVYEKVQNDLDYVILDEIDSILIDESRTPIVISTSSNCDNILYYKMNFFFNKFFFYYQKKKNKYYIINEKEKQVNLTDLGYLKLEEVLINNKIIENYTNLYNLKNMFLLNIFYAVVKANTLFRKNIDYVILDNKIVIIDENTGRMIKDRRWSDGIHQAIEVKEKLFVSGDNVTLASITYKNYFQLYIKLVGMSGTVYSEYSEFKSIYNIDVLKIPNNKLNVRIDKNDLFFLTRKYKYYSIINDINKCFINTQPVLIGTTSVKSSEYLSDFLNFLCIPHNILNAKFHYNESKIILNAGKFSSVTISTNMAGRGADIILGGNNDIYNIFYFNYKKVVNLGGLKIIGTERHESRRIDNQLKGRSGRQGDPGVSQFYVSLEDDLIRIFISDSNASLLGKLSLKYNEVITNDVINKIIKNAQDNIESRNFEIRKQLLIFDDVVDDQRKIIYNRRNYILISNNVYFMTIDIIMFIVNNILLKYVNYNKINVENLFNFIDFIFFSFGIKINLNNLFDYSLFFDHVINEFLIYYNKKCVNIGFFKFNNFEKMLFINILDIKWREYLNNIEDVKKNINLRYYINKDPKDEYKKETYIYFVNMLYKIKYEYIKILFNTPIDVVLKNIRNNYNVLYNCNINVFFHISYICFCRKGIYLICHS